MRKIGIITAFFVVIIPFFVHGYTSPGKPSGFVNDFANIIPVDQKNQLEATLSDFQKKSGNEITVVTIPTLGDEYIENYAVKLFEEWGIGDKEKDNGLLLLVALEERKMRIEVGYGLEGYITDAQSSLIIRNILTPAFKSGEYGGGISEAVSVIMGILKGESVSIPDTDTEKFSFGDWFIFLLFIPLWLASILGRSKSWWLGGVLGGIAGIAIGIIFFSIFTGTILTVVLIVVGLIFDFIVSKSYASNVAKGKHVPWWIGGGGFGGHGGGGFGGFGGGGSGGGGSSGSW